MNIISNNCIGGYIYTETKKEYENPFIWTNILTDEFTRLVNSYNSINFMNYTISYEHTGWNDNGDLPKDTLVTTVHVDNLINIYYTHHLYYQEFNEMHFLEGANRLISNNMKEYVNKKYINRVNRMLNDKEKPLFIYLEWDYDCASDKLLENNNDNIIILSGKYETNISPNKEIYNFKDIHPTIKYIPTLYGAQWLIQNSKLLKRYLN